jgi:hypothetical protein
MLPKYLVLQNATKELSDVVKNMIFSRKGHHGILRLLLIIKCFMYLTTTLSMEYVMDEGLAPLKTMMYFHELSSSLEIYAPLFGDLLIFVCPKLPKGDPLSLNR